MVKFHQQMRSSNQIQQKLSDTPFSTKLQLVHAFEVPPTKGPLPNDLTPDAKVGLPLHAAAHVTGGFQACRRGRLKLRRPSSRMSQIRDGSPLRLQCGDRRAGYTICREVPIASGFQLRCGTSMYSERITSSSPCPCSQVWRVARHPLPAPRRPPGPACPSPEQRTSSRSPAPADPSLAP